MGLILENVLDEYSPVGNPCFRVNFDETFGNVSINPDCHNAIVSRIFEAFDKLGFTSDCIDVAAVIGSSITPLSTDKSVVDVAIVTENSKLYEQVRNKLYSDSVVDKIVRSSLKLSSINFNDYPDEESMEKLVYALRPYILNDFNKKKVSEEVEMRVYFIIEPNTGFLDGENHFKIIENGKRVAQYVSNKKVGYIDFATDVNRKQHYKYVMKPLFDMFKDYKKVLSGIIKNGDVGEEQLENLSKLRIAYDAIKNNRFNANVSIAWKDVDGNVIEYGKNGKKLDYGSTYSYMNVLYHHVSTELMSPYGSDLTLKSLFEIVDDDNSSKEDLVDFAKSSINEFGKFAAGSFLTEKFDRF